MLYRNSRVSRSHFAGRLRVVLICFAVCTSLASLYLTCCLRLSRADVFVEAIAEGGGQAGVRPGPGAVVDRPTDGWLAVRRSVLLADARADLLLRQQRHHIADSAYKFNVTRSDAVSVDRDITDTRPAACRRTSYDVSAMPRVAVIIPFYNEALSTLLRTVHSVLSRTPGALLHQIVLVDDCSEHDWLQQPLARYVDLLPGVLLVRNSRREGLIRSRLRGLHVSSAPVVVFIDAHTECNVGWLPPLLQQLLRHPTAVVQPFVDGIDEQTIQYTKPNDVHKGGFTWDLRYVWMRTSEREEQAALLFGQPFASPTLVGCAIAVNRTSFEALGTFDDGMNVWGGENIELAFRAWMCGGQVLTVPCSRIGHLFRALPYVDEAWQARWQKNLMRVADVWLGDYRRYFYLSTRVYPARRVNFTAAERTSLQRRVQLRQALRCHTFDWYLANVVPELPLPPHDASFHGEITNYHTDSCWEVLDDGYVAMTSICYEHKLLASNIFTLTTAGLLLYGDRCVVYEPPAPNLRVVPCPRQATTATGVWSGDLRDDRWMQIRVSIREDGRVLDYCIDHVTSVVEPHRRAQMPQTSPCNEQSDFQIWAFTYRFDLSM